VRLEIAQPPPTLFIRDLAAASSFALSLEARELGLSVEWSNDVLVIEGDGELLAESLRMTFDSSIKSLEDLSNYTRVPSLHQNDTGAWRKRLSMLGPPPPDYIGFAGRVLKWALNALSKGKLDIFVKELGEVKVEGRDVILGSGVMTNLQPFKVEKYEYGKDFSDFKVKYDTKLGIPWLAYIMAGFSFTYSSFTAGEMLFSLVHDRLLGAALRDPAFLRDIVISLKYKPSRLHEAFLGPKGLLSYPRRLKLSPDPLHAYLLLLACTLVKDFLAKPLKESLPFMLARVAFTGRTYTLMERSSVDIKPLVDFAIKLREEEDALDFVTTLSSCAIRLSHRPDRFCSSYMGDLSKILRATMSLYTAIIGSGDKYATIYAIARNLRGGSVSSGILKAILSALP